MLWIKLFLTWLCNKLPYLLFLLYFFKLLFCSSASIFLLTSFLPFGMANDLGCESELWLSSWCIQLRSELMKQSSGCAWEGYPEKVWQVAQWTEPWQSWSSLCIPASPRTHWDTPASALRRLGLNTWTTLPNSCLSFGSLFCPPIPLESSRDLNCTQHVTGVTKTFLMCLHQSYRFIVPWKMSSTSSLLYWEKCVSSHKFIFFNLSLAPMQSHRIYQLPSSLDSPFQFCWIIFVARTILILACITWQQELGYPSLLLVSNAPHSRWFLLV